MLTEDKYDKDFLQNITSKLENKMAVLCGMPTIQYSAKKRF